MEKSELLFYSAYEEFYKMAKQSKVFKNFCQEAFGEDFSQDGFSDIKQINRILGYIPSYYQANILDVGCGNGKMLKYLQEKTDAFIYGFDYSKQAIETARNMKLINSDFQVGIIGEMEYSTEKFDVVISMDTIYFAHDISKFLNQVKDWLKKNGIFFVGYQEGDVIPKTKTVNDTKLTRVLIENNLSYEVIDITEEAFLLLNRKRFAALNYKREFQEEGLQDWYQMLLNQTEYASGTYEEFKSKMSRYIYIIRK